MICRENYNELLKRFGNVASWAMWMEQTGASPKSNVGDLSVFDDPNLLDKLNTGFVFVGLNASNKHDDFLDYSRAWFNFHSSSPRGHDYKLRFALSDTPMWGSYITDIIKYYPEVDSAKVINYVKNNPEVLNENIVAFKEELGLLGGDPTIVALGNATYDFLKKHLGKEYAIVKVMHFSYRIGKEKYRKEMLKALS